MDQPANPIEPLPGSVSGAAAEVVSLASAHGGQRPGRWMNWLVCGLLLLTILLVFGRTVRYQFVSWDDDDYVSANPHVQHGLSAKEAGWAMTHLHTGFWLPLVWISYMVDSQWCGLWAGGYHLTNVLLHAATAIGLFLALRRMSGDVWPSALAAALFAIHPLRVESVAWITERKDVLNGFFFVLALGAYAEFAGRPFSLLRYVAVVACFVASLMTKPITVTLPAVLLLLDAWPLERFQRSSKSWLATAGRLVLEKLPLFVVSAAFCAMTVLLVKGAKPAEQPPWMVRIGESLLSDAVYVGRTFWPAGLAPAYPDTHGLAPMGAVALAAFIVVAISCAALTLRRRHPYFLIGWLWYLGMLLPVSRIWQQGTELRPDRLIYLPQIGLMIALAWGVTALIRAFPAMRSWTLSAVGIVVVCMLVAAWRQVGYWANSETLWARSLEITPNNPGACVGLGMARVGMGRVAEALELFQQALRLNPKYPKAHCSVGAVLALSGRTSEAIEHYRQAIRYQPGYAEAHNNLGNALTATGHFADAIDECREALRIQPDFAEAHFNLASVLVASGRPAEAVEQFELAIADKHDYVAAHCQCGNVLLDTNRLPEAIEHYRQAVRISPRYGPAQSKLAEALLKADYVAEALEHSQVAAQLMPNDAPAHSIRGQCLAKAGRRTDAIAQFEQALRMAEKSGPALLAEAIRAQLREFQGTKP